MGRNNKDFKGGQSNSDDKFDYKTSKRVTGKYFNPKPPSDMNKHTPSEYSDWYEEKHT